MALGLKQIETRHWWTSHRGLVAIHAAKRWTADERDFAAAMGLSDLPLGAVVAVGELVSVCRTNQFGAELSPLEESWGNYAPGRYGWKFKNLVGLREPVPYRGAQGFFELSDDATAAVLAEAVGLASCAADLFGQCS